MTQEKSRKTDEGGVGTMRRVAAVALCIFLASCITGLDIGGGIGAESKRDIVRNTHSVSLSASTKNGIKAGLKYRYRLADYSNMMDYGFFLSFSFPLYRLR